MTPLHAPHIDYGGLSPLLALSAGICVTLLIGLARGPGTRAMVTTAALLTLVAAATLSAWQLGENKTLVVGALRADDLAFALDFVFYAAAAAALILSLRYPGVEGASLGDYSVPEFFNPHGNQNYKLDTSPDIYLNMGGQVSPATNQPTGTYIGTITLTCVFF